MDVASCLGWAGKNSRIRKESAGADLRNPFRTVPGVYSSCVTILNTRKVGQLWLSAATFLKGQEMEWLRRKSPLRVEWSGLGEIQRTIELVMPPPAAVRAPTASAVGSPTTTTAAVESAATSAAVRATTSASGGAR